MEESADNLNDFQVGNRALDHSEKFLAQHHSKHERQQGHMSGVELLCADENMLEGQQQQNEPFELRLEQQRRELVLNDAQRHADNLAKHLNMMKISNAAWPKPQLKPPNWACAPPQAYQFKDIYKQKKEMLLHRNMEEQRKMREFRSRPMPNFQQVHEHQANRQFVHRVTHAVTPNVLKTSRAMQQKRREKTEQLLRQREEEELNLYKLRPKVKPTPRKFSSLPLQPLKTSHQKRQSTQSQLIVKPFRFSTELRAQERKQFDEQAQQAQEQRRKQQQEQRRQQELLAYKKQRELATFRARPNPFKTGVLASATIYQ